MKASVVLNAAAGLRPGQVQAEAETIRSLFSGLGVPAEVRRVSGPALPDAAREAALSDSDVVVMGGGDGTMSAGAGALAGTGKPMGLLPLGTLNHFARDLGVPSSLEDAVRTVARGTVREVDVGEANGRVFVNNSSIGLYPVAVSLRDAWMERYSTHKWVAMGRAALHTLRRFPVVRVTLRVLEGGLVVTTPMVFIGNNRYETRLFSLGRRASLDQGELWVYLARDAGRLGLLRLGLNALIGRLDDVRDFLGLALPEMQVEDRRRVLEVAFDGEVCQMAPPLHYRIRRRTLRVLVPPEP
ncbi:MAG TPA: diacylglycerol kinase family protein [Vicinamibacteria bacterium]|nr:diacylglycerol kinase family protein [Vicinamibacteria bacterium]